MTDTALRGPTCRRCLELAEVPDPGGGKLRTRDRLFDRAAVLALAPDACDGHTHAAWESGVLAEYVLPSTGQVLCSNADKTKHRTGVVLTTKCGVVIKMGWECADKYVANASEMRKRLREAEAYEQRLVQLGDAAEYRERAQAWKAREDALRQSMDRIRLFLPEIVREMGRRLGLDGAARTKVTRTWWKNGAKQVTEYTLHGLELWDRPPNTAEILADAEALVAEVALVTRDHGDEDAGLVARISRGLDGVRGRLERADDWFRAGAAFFSSDNLRIVGYAVGNEDLQVQGDALVFVSPDLRYVIGVEGPKVTSPFKVTAV
jgi:hypothetical protein